jgi:hypothetical protein
MAPHDYFDFLPPSVRMSGAFLILDIGPGERGISTLLMALRTVSSGMFDIELGIDGLLGLKAT